MTTLALQRCLNHPAREAAARCTQCAQNYCRECVVEHDSRLLCAACLRGATKRSAFREVWLKRIASQAHLLIALMFLWLCFFTLGKTLLQIPASFHEGSVWKNLDPSP